MGIYVVWIRDGMGEGIVRGGDGWKEMTDWLCLRFICFWKLRPREDNSHLFFKSTGEWARGCWLITWQRRSRHTMNFTTDKSLGHWNHWPSALWVGWHALLQRPSDTSVWRSINVVLLGGRRMDKLMAGFLHSSLAIFILNPIPVLRRYPTMILKKSFSFHLILMGRKEDRKSFSGKKVSFLYRKGRVAQTSVIHINTMDLNT